MKLTGWERETSPFHRGEQELQNRLGMKDKQERVGRQILRPYMPEQHQEFFAQLPFVIAGSVDADGWPWASMLPGRAGFISNPTDRALHFDGGQIMGDPFWSNIVDHRPVGFVGIELSTRRRNRVNGIVNNNSDGLHVDVVQSFGNCPQYIHTRDLQEVRDPQLNHAPEISPFNDLSNEIAMLIEHVDTFFVASHNPEDDAKDTGGVDVSHRGGKPGFVKVDGNTLTIPDYMGNFAFNTFGNFLVNPKAGLIFIDFSNGDIVQLTGTVELLWEGSPELKAFRGAERGWRFQLTHGHVLKNASPYRWSLMQSSPNAELTGDWQETEEIMSAQAQRNVWHSFKVTNVVDESTVIRSFYLEAENGNALPGYKPGQFLTVRVKQGQEQELIRNYTLSSAPSDARYRISVKRDGRVSSYLHQKLTAGDLVDVRLPNGAFWMDMDERRPAVMIAAGVGITPMVAMARQAATDQFARRHHRPMTLIHASKTTAQRAFAKELSELEFASGGALKYASVISQPAEGETLGLNYHAEGRVNTELLQNLLPIDDYDFYLCGPASFMQSIYDTLISLGVEDEKIFAETFGPASLKRIEKAKTSGAVDQQEIASEAIVNFEESQVEQAWTPEQGTLLEFSEAHGIRPNFSCRSGNCGACLTRLKSGKVAYETEPTFPVGKNEVLLCCAMPAKSDEVVSLEL